MDQIESRPRRGRPPKPDCEKYRQRMVRMSDADYERIVQRAERNGVSFSEYMRRRALDEDEA